MKAEEAKEQQVPETEIFRKQQLFLPLTTSSFPLPKPAFITMQSGTFHLKNKLRAEIFWKPGNVLYADLHPVLAGA